MTLGSLVYNHEDGVVRFSGSYKASPDDVVKLDILSDWIGDLQAEYDRVHAITFPIKGRDEPQGKSETEA
jgi:hypothetical protein